MEEMVPSNPQPGRAPGLHCFLFLTWFLIANLDTFMEETYPVKTEKECYALAKHMHLQEENYGVRGYICRRADQMEHKDPYDPI